MRTESGPVTIGGVVTGALVDMVTVPKRVLGLHSAVLYPQ